MEQKELDWNTIKRLSAIAVKKYPQEYAERLTVEIKEIEKQGANENWVQLFNNGHKYETNKNGLVLPFLLRMTTVDPMATKHKFEQQTDWPDIDIDVLPEARDLIKKYATDKYGRDYVCSVGTWMTYKFKLAMQDVARAIGVDVNPIIVLNKLLPDDVDELKDEGRAPCQACQFKHAGIKCPKCGSEETDGMTFGQLLRDNEPLRAYYQDNKEVVGFALRLVGRIKCLGKHAGGLIISNKILRGNVPMAMSGDQLTSMWTEGRSSHLAKFGYVKWDVLGLKTLLYIRECCKMVERNHGVKFNVIPWKDMNPHTNCLGHYFDAAGVKRNIEMDDPAVFKIVEELRMESIFQFDTEVQRGVLANGVRNFYDLQVFNAMGHPGPMACAAKGQLVSIVDGYKKIESLDPKNDKIAFLSKTGLAYTSNYRPFKTGRRKVYKIELENGKTVRLTEDHLVYCNGRYKPVKDIVKGDIVNVKKQNL